MIPHRTLDFLSPTAIEQVIFYAYYDSEGQFYVLSSDDYRFTNHSENPNSKNTGAWRTIAIRDIQPGEEITWGYGPDWKNYGGAVWEGKMA